MNIRNRAGWFALLVVPLAFLISYRSTIVRLVHQWMSNDNYSHGLLIVPIALYLVWRKRADLKAAEIRPDWRALSLVFFGLAVGVVGELGAELFTIRFSMLLVAIALVWFICGSHVLRILGFPLAFLFLMLPLPGFVYRNLTSPLQLLSSAGAVRLLNSLGITAYREGNIIDVGVTQLQVVEACSGLRYILPLLAFGILYAYFGQKANWKRVVLVAATLPIAIIANIFRLAGAGISAMYWGAETAEGFFHATSALVVILFCAMLFALLNLLLNKIPGYSQEDTAAAAKTTHLKAKSLKGVTWASIVTALVVIFASGPALAYLGQVPPIPSKRSLSDFPLDFQGWKGTRSQMEAAVWEQVGGQDYVIIGYFKPDESRVNFYVVYYEYQRKAGDFIHSPRLCLPGSGWYIEENRVREIPTGTGMKENGAKIEINELLITKNGAAHLLYFWYQGRGRNFTNEYAAKFYLVWDGLTRRRTDGALVRLAMPLEPGKGVEDARETLDRFALAASSMLEDFLP